LAELGAPSPNESELAASEPVVVEDAERLQHALSALSPEDRVAVQLYVVEEMPAADVARVVGLPNAKAVYNRVYRALAFLRARLEPAKAPAKTPLSISDRSGRLTGA
jgi:DNA-directed RNA polymerase specialized sigma24 family protein